MKYQFLFLLVLLGCGCSLLLTSFTRNAPLSNALLKYYARFIQRSDSSTVVMKNGVQLSLRPSKKTHDNLSESEYEKWLNSATLGDQLVQEYQKGKPSTAPAINSDPGRARSEKFFEAVYGASESEVSSHCTTVRWVDGTSLRVTTVLGCHTHLLAVIRELQQLPSNMQAYLRQPGGSLNWRMIAGTKRRSTHSYGIALDINVGHSYYWRNARNANGQLPYKNEIPWSIVEIFEKHGFIWGGKWYHYDTMHFEFRPELCPPSCSCE